MTLKELFAFLIIPLPSILKVPLMRLVLGFRIGKSCRIGLSVVSATEVDIGDRVKFGNFNFFIRSKRLAIGADVNIGHCNLLIGGENVKIEDGVTIGRFNEINSIINSIVRGSADPCLHVGRRAVITAWHKIDFTDRVSIGESAIIAGRLSSIWTHNRQDVGPVSIGKGCYVGSGVQFVPGSSVADECVVGLGAVITKPFAENLVLIAGVPAVVIKSLDEKSIRLVSTTTRFDLPAL